MSAKYNNRKTQVLNDVYRKEGHELMTQDDFEGAIKKYTEALHQYPRDLKSFVNRSKCYMELKNVRKAVDDIETALHLNNLYKEALLQKAEILYQTQDYDLAFIYFHRGHKVYPRNKAFLEGMKKSEHEINKSKKGKGKRQKLTPAGDLTFLIHKVPDPKPFKFQPIHDRKVKHVPSATFNTRPLCQLIRIHKTPSVSLMKSVSVPDLNEMSDDEDMNEKRPESRLVKSTIGEFYDDKKYLEKLASKSQITPRTSKTPRKVDRIEEEKDEDQKETDNQENEDQNKREDVNKVTNKDENHDDDTEENHDENNEKNQDDSRNENRVENRDDQDAENTNQNDENEEQNNVAFNETSKPKGTTKNTKIGDDAPLWGTPLEAMANNALHFLFDRVAYWDRLGPLPPPPPYSRAKSNKLSASTMSLNSFLSTNTANTATSKITSDSSYVYVEKKRAPTYRRRNSQALIKLEPSKLHFNFKSVQNGKENRKMSRIPEERDLHSYGPTPSGFGDATPESAGQSITDYVRKEINHIAEGYKLGWMQETIGSCESCLRLLEKYSEEEVPEKLEMTAILHSYSGNCAVQNRQFDEALRHHNADLSIGDKNEMRSCRFRALGNIGRVYMLQGKHQKALETLTMKAPLCKTPKESASLFHEIGNCFLVMSHFRYAKDAARKSLQCSEECGEKRLQLQACVLMGLADVNMKKYKEAHKSFEEALTHAQALGDKKAEEAMEQALIDVNKKIAHKLKTKTIHNRTNELNQQSYVEAV